MYTRQVTKKITGAPIQHAALAAATVFAITARLPDDRDEWDLTVFISNRDQAGGGLGTGTDVPIDVAFGTPKTTEPFEWDAPPQILAGVLGAMGQPAIFAPSTVQVNADRNIGIAVALPQGAVLFGESLLKKGWSAPGNDPANPPAFGGLSAVTYGIITLVFTSKRGLVSAVGDSRCTGASNTVPVDWRLTWPYRLEAPDRIVNLVGWNGAQVSTYFTAASGMAGAFDFAGWQRDQQIAMICGFNDLNAGAPANTVAGEAAYVARLMQATGNRTLWCTEPASSILVGNAALYLKMYNSIIGPGTDDVPPFNPGALNGYGLAGVVPVPLYSQMSNAGRTALDPLYDSGDGVHWSADGHQVAKTNIEALLLPWGAD